MTLAAGTPINAYTGNAGTNTYAFTFPVFSQSHLLVTVTSPSPAFTPTTLVIGTDYTVTGLSPSGDPASTGSIVLVNSGQTWLTAGNLATGWGLVVQINLPLAQTTSIRNQGDFYRAGLENALDNLDMQIQQLELAIGAQLILPTGLLPSVFSPVLPGGMPSNPGLALVVNPAGNGFALGAGSSVAIPVSIAQGGTGSTVALLNNRILKSSGGKIIEAAAIAAAKILISDANGIPIAANANADMGANKITGLANGSAATDAAAFGQIPIIYQGFQAPVQATVTGASSTTSSTFAATTLTASITPTSASHRIKITISGTLKSSNGTNSAAQMTIARGTTNLGSANGFAIQTNPASVNVIEVPVGVTYIDSPATASPVTYTVYIRNTDNATTVYFNFSTLTCVMILEEIV